MGTLSLGVIERRREIGLMRAIGASNRIVIKSIVVEALVIGLLGWVLSSLLVRFL